MQSYLSKTWEVEVEADEFVAYGDNTPPPEFGDGSGRLQEVKDGICAGLTAVWINNQLSGEPELMYSVQPCPRVSGGVRTLTVQARNRAAHLQLLYQKTETSVFGSALASTQWRQETRTQVGAPLPHPANRPALRAMFSSMTRIVEPPVPKGIDDREFWKQLKGKYEGIHYVSTRSRRVNHAIGIDLREGSYQFFDPALFWLRSSNRQRFFEIFDSLVNVLDEKEGLDQWTWYRIK